MTRLLRLRLTLVLLATLASALPACRDHARDLPLLIKQLSDKESTIRNKAALELGAIGKKAEPAVPALIRLLKDPNGGVQTSAAYALRQIDSPRARKALAHK